MSPGRRRRHPAAWRLVAMAVAGLGAGCALFEDDPPDRSCTGNDDCFRAQGEVCDLVSRTCVVATAPDAAPAGPDAAPPAPDATTAASAEAP